MISVDWIGYNQGVKPLLPLLLLLLLGADAPSISETQVRDLWRMHWPRYASLYVSVGDDFTPCAKYDRRYDSSRKLTVGKVKSATRQTRTVRIGDSAISSSDSGETTPIRGAMMTREEISQIPTDDADAIVKSIPDLKVGEFGFIAGAKVVEVLGPLEMIVEEIKLIDETKLAQDMDKVRQDLARKSTARNDRRAVDVQVDYRFQMRKRLLEAQGDREFQKVKLKIVGFDTNGFEKGMTWPGPDKTRREDGIQIAIVKTDPMPETEGATRARYRRRSREIEQILVAIPASRFQFRELSEEQFKQILQQRGFDETRFVQLILEQAPKRGDDTEEWVIRALEQSKPAPAEEQNAEESRD